MEILLGGNNAYDSAVLLKGIRERNPYEQVRFIAEIIKGLRAEVADAKTGLNPEKVDRGNMAEEALRLLKESL